MPTKPSIRCAKCGCTDLEAHLVHGPGAGKDVDAFNCRGCGFGWKAWETPLFSTPNYASAYSGNPDLVDEELALLLLAEDVNARSTAALTHQGPAVDSSEHRELLLRRAAYLDRAARELELDVYRTLYAEAAVSTASTMAVHAAFDFLKFDLDYASVHVLGPIGPDSPEFDPADGTRAYVRQEFLAWHERASRHE